MQRELSSNRQLLERFKTEILSLAGIRHPNVVRIHTFGKCEVSGCWYYVMDFVAGQSLEQRLKQSGPLSLDAAWPIFDKLAAGLEAVHAHGLIHRDIKPANIILAASGEPVLVDFGLAMTGDADVTTTGHSAIFAAPEQATSGRADVRSDVFSLAATLLYAMRYEDEAARNAWMFEAEHAPEAMREVLVKALSRTPAKRHASISEFRAALQHADAEVRQKTAGAQRAHKEAEKRERERQSAEANRVAERLAREDEERERQAAEARQEEDLRAKYATSVEGFTFLREQTFSCGGQTHTVGIYRCDLFQQALKSTNALTGDADPASEFVYIPCGSFQMGGGLSNAFEPVHVVTLKPLLMARTPLVQAVWDGVAKLKNLKLADERQWREPRLPLVLLC